MQPPRSARQPVIPQRGAGPDPPKISQVVLRPQEQEQMLTCV